MAPQMLYLALTLVAVALVVAIDRRAGNVGPEDDEHDSLDDEVEGHVGRSVSNGAMTTGAVTPRT